MTNDKPMQKNNKLKKGWWMISLSFIIYHLSFSVALCVALSSCVNEDELPNTRQGNFEALWKMIDEHYCFFDYKQQ